MILAYISIYWQCIQAISLKNLKAFLKKAFIAKQSFVKQVMQGKVILRSAA